MFKWLFRQCLDAMGKKRNAEVKMVGASDAQEAIQALDVGYTATVELIYAQAETIARLQKELQEAQAGAGEGASGSQAKASKKPKKLAPEPKEDEKMEEVMEEVIPEPKTEKVEEVVPVPEEEKKEEKKEWVTPEEEKKAKEEILGGEKKKEEPMSEKREVSVEQLRIPFIKPPAPPSEVSSQVLDDEDQPQSKKRRGQYEEPWQCYRCLTVCGNLSKRCQVPIKELSPPALLGAWLRLAHKGRSDVRQEYPALTEELKARGLVAPPDKSQGERMLQDLKKALRLGSRIPPEWLLSTVSVEEVVEAPVTPMTPPPSPALPASSTTETEQEFRSRVQVVLDALRNSGTSPEVEAQVLASLTKKP